MLVYAYEFLLQLDDKAKITKVMKTFNQVAIEVCEGQQYYMNFETRDNVSIDEYIKMIEQKTAVLIAGWLKIGATPVLSLEVFNRDYWKQDAKQVARTGLEKMKSKVKKALG